MNKSAPAPELPEGTELQRFEHLLRTVISVPKSAIDREEAKLKPKKKRAKKP